MVPVTLKLPVGDHPPTANLYYGADAKETLRHLRGQSVHSVVTSPPYWGLRDYRSPAVSWSDGWEGELGQEPDLEAFITHMVEVFREVHRVLRDDGTLWLNLGDSYYKKRLQGVPWRVALALQEEGWILRNDIIWHKKNSMPHPVRDRLRTIHEHIFLFSKSEKYFFNLADIRVPHTYGTYKDGEFVPAQNWLSEDPTRTDRKMDNIADNMGQFAGPARRFGRGLHNPKGKNPGDVWQMATQPFKEAHYAVFPEELVERCITASTNTLGACPSCGALWLEGENDMIPGCTCQNTDRSARPTILDPFSGSGTTGKVALSLGCHYVGLDVNDSYLDMASRRVLSESSPGTGDGNTEGRGILDLFLGD